MGEPTTLAVDVATASKTCKKCCLAKPLTDFYRDGQNSDGRRGSCIECWIARDRARRFANHDEALERERLYREANRDLVRERSRLSARKHMGQYVERQRRRGSFLKAVVLAWYGESCACCATTDRLTIDHIDGRGREHREELFGSNKAAGRIFHSWLIKNNFPDGYQTLCARCNVSKRRGPRCKIAHRQRREGGI